MPRRESSGGIVIPTAVFEPKLKIQITDDNNIIHNIIDTSKTISYYPFNNSLEDITAGNDAVNDGGVDIVYAEGKYNMSASFSLQIFPDCNRLAITSDITSNDSYSISIWILPDQFGLSCMILEGTTLSSPSIEGDASNGGYRFYVNNNKYAWTGVLELGKWTHLVAVWDNDTSIGKLYVNGVFKDSFSDTTDDDFETLYIGARSTGYNYYLGKLDELQIYNYVLSESQIQDIYSHEGIYQSSLINCSITKTAKESLGRFNMQIANNEGRFTNVFNGGEVVEIYYDYNDASTLFFRGRIDNPKMGLSDGTGFYLDIDGRDYPELADKTIVASFISSRIDNALKSILLNNYSDITFTYWENSAWTTSPTTLTTTISAEYQNQKGITVISDICKRGDLDCYLEYDGQWYLRVFAINSKKNATETITYGINLLGISEFGADYLSVKNRAIVYGKSESDNILLLRTKNDLDSQADKWIKDEIVTDSSISTNESCTEKANTILTQNSTVYKTGSLSTVGLYSIKPGELINISIPYMNINDYYKIQEYTTDIGQNGVTTSLSISQKVPKLVDVFKRHDNTEELVSAYENLNNMTNSYVVWFDEQPSLMTLSGCEEVEGKLQLIAGQIEGTAVLTNSYVADEDITYCEFRRYENYSTDLDILEVSNNGGVNWETIDKNASIHTFSTMGRHLKFRITLNRDLITDPTPAYESIAILFR